MATLWTVTHPGITVPLLMKVPRVAEGEDPAAIVSFEMEQMIVPRLAGPHVPGCFGTGDFDRQPYVVIERIPGKTLYSRIAELPLPYEEARVIGGKIATALADLHRQNVIHHDIKPSSIMFRADRRRRADRFRPVASQPVAGPAAGGIPSALWHRALYGAGASARRPRRSAQRPVFAGRAACISSPPASGRSARARRCAACAGGCGAIPIRRASSGPTIRPGCRKSCCGAWRSSRSGAIRRLRNWRSNWPIPNRSS